MKNIVIFIIVGMVFSGTCGFCLETTNDNFVRSVTGEVSKVDWVGDKIIVRTFYGNDYDEITFVAGDGTIITKSDNNISLANINTGDKVTVKYSGDLTGLQALQIVVRQ